MASALNKLEMYEWMALFATIALEVNYYPKVNVPNVFNGFQEDEVIVIDFAFKIFAKMNGRRN